MLIYFFYILKYTQAPNPLPPPEEKKKKKKKKKKTTFGTSVKGNIQFCIHGLLLSPWIVLSCHNGFVAEPLFLPNV